MKGKKVLVCGASKSGISAANLCIQLGATVILSDYKTKDKLDLEGLDGNVKLNLGENPTNDLIDNQHLIVLSPGIPIHLDFIKYMKETNKNFISEFELAYRCCKGKIVAITGSNGKTTTTSLVGEILKATGKDTYVLGNIGEAFSSKVLQIKEDDYVVLEASSFQLETIDKFRPEVSAITNITPDHIDWHGSMQNYAAAKMRIYKNQTMKDLCVLNYDDELCKNVVIEPKKMFFSTSEQLNVGISLENDLIVYKDSKQRIEFCRIDELNLVGIHNVQNVMTAIGIALGMNIDIDIIKDMIKKFKPVEHRLEYVNTVNGVKYYNDSKGTNPDSTVKAINSMNSPIIIILGGYDKKMDFSEVFESLKGKVKNIVIIGQTTDQIYETAIKFNMKDISFKVNTFEETVDKCYELAEKGDCVLLSPACASWGMFDNYKQRGEMFKELVNSLNKEDSYGKEGL